MYNANNYIHDYKSAYNNSIREVREQYWDAKAQKNAMKKEQFKEEDDDLLKGIPVE